MKKTTACLLIILILQCIVFSYEVFSQSEAEDIVVESIAIGDVKDGVYIGESMDTGDMSMIVEVIVKKGEIKDIVIVSSKGDWYARNAKHVIKGVIASQSLKVDTVTGATISSNAILKAVENALKKGKR
ncbi:FMN-binding protein [Candidatus Omnitrophota bacterium]